MQNIFRVSLHGTVNFGAWIVFQNKGSPNSYKQLMDFQHHLNKALSWELDPGLTKASANNWLIGSLSWPQVSN